MKIRSYFPPRAELWRPFLENSAQPKHCQKGSTTLGTLEMLQSRKTLQLRISEVKLRKTELISSRKMKFGGYSRQTAETKSDFYKMSL